MIGCCCNIESQWQISDIADFSNIIIAAVNLVLAGYIFIYQKDKDKSELLAQSQKEIDAKQESLKLQEQNIKLLWFKELIVQPHINDIKDFFKCLYSIEQKLNVSPISDDLKIEVSEFVKSQGVNLRKSFIDVLLTVNPDLHSDIKKNIDGLIDEITTKIIDAGLNLNDKPTFDREIGTLISYSHNDLISRLYSYKGV